VSALIAELQHRTAAEAQTTAKFDALNQASHNELL